ncbi:PucR family transcriptional regulator [Candidatus Enterococcus ferrettii]|uniref:PucR family transcriptional regulator n=1 Tax=Candidatus Enterococcus ferrettii TaxID=2815324 RepID=A0ABV0EYC0_9ENTE|nr:PucR family transcriptional regulator [Enterococcus sp. 665A]MBO1338696.1 PucR family transcriptional regulator [Enterococcus sp. 665A]
MSIAIREVLAFDYFHFLSLAAGKSGLDNEITTVGILEYEYDEGLHPKRKFDVNTLVITSLYFAKNKPDLLVDTIRLLYRDGVSGLIVKKIFFQELPVELLAYANEINFPIFTYEQSATPHFEDILFQLKQVISFDGQQKILEMLVEELLAGEAIPEARIQSLLFQQEQLKKFALFYLLPDRLNLPIVHWLSLINNYQHSSFFIRGIGYQQGFFVLLGIKKHSLKEESFPPIADLFQQIGLPATDFMVGRSLDYRQTAELKNAFSEALISAQFGEKSQNRVSSYEELGVYQLLIPYYQDASFSRYSQMLLHKIKQNDPSKKQKLLETARAFIHYEGNLSMMADALEIHENSVRYRLHKLKELLSHDSLVLSDFALYEQLSLAIKTDELLTKE